MKRTILLTTCLLALAHAASAADLTDPVPGHPGVTLFDLAKLVVTDLANGPDGATGHKVVAFRHIEGKDMLAPPEDPVTLGVPPVDMAAVPGSTDRVLALIDLGASDGNVEEAELLALVGFDPKPKLLDVVEVGNDRWTAMEDNPPLLAPGAPLIVIDSDHWNSNQTYNAAEMIFVRGDRFQLIDSLFTYTEAYCGYQHFQEVTYGTAASGGPYRAVTVSVRDTTKLTDDDCGTDQKPPKPGVTVYSGTYRWDAAHARFVSHSAQLDKLDALNTKWLKDGS
ncbi:MAG TPA: hypothetical protein VN805_13640 [Caulobacteraceae bacterium]|nr:hypothetical protein [Caulobacteraceae bacterium]